MKLFLYLLTISLSISVFASQVEVERASKKEGYLELKVYHFTNNQQAAILDNFIQKVLLPHLRSSGIKNVGVFKAIANDTASDKKLYVLIPFNSLKQWEKYLTADKNHPSVNNSNEFANSVNEKPAYTRVETIFLKCFKMMPGVSVPKLNNPKNERVYELRSYESAGEKLHVNKVQMFNEGGEVDIFARLGFNAVFYGSVIYGAKMPNLMYMTSFDNMKARNEHWAAFGADPAWKTLSVKKEYEKNVSKIEVIFLRPTDYSDL